MGLRVERNLDDWNRTRRRLRRADVVAQPRVHAGRGADACAGDRRERRDLQPGRRDAPAAAESRESGRALHDQVLERVPRLPRVRRAAGSVQRGRRELGRPPERGGGRAGGAGRLPVRLGELLRCPRHCACCGPADCAGRRRAEWTDRGGAGLPVVADTVRRRPGRRRHGHSRQQRARHDHRRRPEGLPRHQPLRSDEAVPARHADAARSDRILLPAGDAHESRDGVAERDRAAEAGRDAAGGGGRHRSGLPTVSPAEARQQTRAVRADAAPHPGAGRRKRGRRLPLRRAARRRRRADAADRVRQPGEPAALSGCGEAPRDRRPHGDRGGPRADRAPVAD